jgi:hypothetical protein
MRFEVSPKAHKALQLMLNAKPVRLDKWPPERRARPIRHYQPPTLHKLAVTLPMSASTACSSRLSKSKIHPGLNNRRWRYDAGGFFLPAATRLRPSSMPLIGTEGVKAGLLVLEGVRSSD